MKKTKRVYLKSTYKNLGALKSYCKVHLIGDKWMRTPCKCPFANSANKYHIKGCSILNFLSKLNKNYTINGDLKVPFLWILINDKTCVTLPIHTEGILTPEDETFLKRFLFCKILEKK